MDRLRKSFRSSFRRKSQHEQDSEIRNVTWPKDEAAVKTNTCSFEVKYLGSVEVFESRGMQICEEALKLLKNSKRQTIRGTLHVSGDGMRVVDKETKGLVLDQTIEKVSFCAPDRSYDKGFSYICRDGTTRRWMCHGFLSAGGDTGERLSHAVGCAFAICLEKKQMREKESVQYHYNKKENVFTRFGSFQQGTIHDRLKDPQVFKPGLEPPKPTEPVANPNALARPRPSDMYLRQASMRGGGRMPVASSSLFKRQYSLRLDELPSTLSRQKSLYTNDLESSSGQGCTTIQEDSISPSKDLSSFGSPPVIEAGSTPSSTQPSNRYEAPLTAPPRLEAAPPRLMAAPSRLEAAGGNTPFTSTPLPKTRPSTVDSPFFPSSGPVSLPVNLSVFNPVSILTEEIPTELPPPILSPTAGSHLSPVNKAEAKPTTTVSPKHILPVFNTLALDAPATSNDASLPDVNGQLVFNPFTSIGVSLGESKMGILPPLPPRSCNPPPLPSRLTGSSQPASLPPTLGPLLSPVGADASQRSLESLGSLPRGSADARGGGVVRGCQAFPVTGSTSSRGSSQASGIIREGFNPWDNVPDQPIVSRHIPGGSGSKVGGRPVSMIECESVSKAAHQLSSTSTMERGYSLEAVIDAGTSNHDQEKQSNLFTLPGESDSSSGFLRDPFDSDWADTALKTKLSPKHYQDKNENSFKSFELHL